MSFMPSLIEVNSKLNGYREKNDFWNKALHNTALS